MSDEEATLSIDDPEIIEAGIAEMERLKKKLRYYGQRILYSMASPSSVTPGLLERIIDEYEGQTYKFEAAPLTESFSLLKGQPLDEECVQAWNNLGVTLLHMGRSPNE